MQFVTWKQGDQIIESNGRNPIIQRNRVNLLIDLILKQRKYSDGKFPFVDFSSKLPEGRGTAAGVVRDSAVFPLPNSLIFPPASQDLPDADLDL